LMGTAGVAFLYVRRELLPELVPTVTGWFAADDIFAMDITGYRPAGTARRFESGTPPVVNIYAGVAGLELLERVGLSAVHQRISELTAQIKAQASEDGYTLVTPVDPDRHGAMVAVRCREVEAVVGALAKRNIVTSHRDDNLRISPHFYNNAADINTLFRALGDLRHLID